MAEKFKVNDLVEVINLDWKNNEDVEYDLNKDWIIRGMASDGGEAIITHLYAKLRTIIKIKNLRHQKK